MATDHTAFWRSSAAALAVMIVLVMLQLLPVPGSFAAPSVDVARRTVKTRGLSAEDREAQNVGYYQELLNSAARVAVRTPMTLDRVMLGNRKDPGGTKLEEITGGRRSLNEAVAGFLVYRPLSNLDVPDPRFPQVRYVANAMGFQDRDYPPVRSPQTRRIVMLGDSMTRGLGAPPGTSFEALLEDDLNRHALTPGVRQFELINLGVSGYRMTQIADVALEVAPTLKPDVYVVGLSWLAVGRRWGLHLAQLFEDGIDLKYEFLRQVVRDAGLKRGESTQTSQAKLAPFMLPTLRWALLAIQARARADGASLVVLLLPHLNGATWFPRGSGSFEPEFGPVRAMLDDQRIPYVDILDAFEERALAGLDAGDGWHPNEQGHRVIFEALQQRIAADPALSELIHGARASRPASGAAASTWGRASGPS